MSCVISYLLLSIISLIRLKFLEYLPNNALINSILAAGIGSLIICFIVVISQRKLFKKTCICLFHKTLNRSIWDDLFDYENGSNLKVYLKDKDYYLIGHLKNIEEKGADSWIALSAFAKMDVKSNSNYRNETYFLDNSDVFIALRLCDIDHIEIF